ncbi:MAG: hypothetical protein ACD_60C00149G0009 [uncultured bacterium]|nr:MAG: hypothetical protein ACD_60C00149G0009 [uncultured bacterium]
MRMPLLKEIDTRDWRSSFSNDLQSLSIETLESGNILFFPHLPFPLLAHETKFLSPLYANPKIKNINFSRHTGLLRGAECDQESHTLLKAMLERFSHHAEELVRHLFCSYSAALQIGRTSFRPVEIAGRTTSYRKDDTRLHVDAFPATPNQGLRILRVFTNINPHGQARIWRVGEPFNDVVKRFLPKIQKPLWGKAFLLNLLRITKSYRTEYDHIMLQIHDRMKKDLAYQQTVPQTEIHFAPDTSWIVQTDHVSHAAMKGQHVLEQTFYLPVTAMKNPDLSPLRTLEKYIGRKLVKY